MRITGNMLSNSLVAQLNTLMARQTRLQNQATTGQRIQAPEDDPAAMAQALSIQEQTSAAAQYAQNISTLQTRATAVSTSLQSLKAISDRAGEIATSADATKSPQELQSYAVEVQQLIQQAVKLANSKDGDQYLFAGTRSDQPPFTATTDSNGNVTAVTYSGNTSVAQTEIAQGSALAVTAPGANATGAGLRGVFSDSRYGADVFNHLLSLEAHLQSGDTSSISSIDSPALGHDEDNLIYQTANNGVLQSRLEAAATDNDKQTAALQQNLSTVAGADLTSTLVQLSQTQNAYQTAMQSTAKILAMQQSQSLLDYLP